MKKIIVASLILVSCTSSAPKRDFTITLYESDYNCLEFFDPEDQVIKRTCIGDEDHPERIRAISLDDYQKERDFQDLLIRQCKKWKN